MEKFIKSLTATSKKNIHITDKRWIDLYDSYYEFDDRVVKIYKVKNVPFQIHMEQIEGFNLSQIEKIKELDWDERRFIYKEVIDIFFKHLSFSHKLLTTRQTFFHNDYHLNNLVYSNGRVRLIDPESFTRFQLDTLYSMYYGKFLETFTTLKNVIAER